MDFSISIDINAAPEHVFAVMRDIERWPEWTPTVTSIERLDEGPLRPGSKARIRQPKLVPAVWVVTAMDEAGHSFIWRTTGPGVSVIAQHFVIAIPGGSRATLSLQFGGFLGGVVARLTSGLNNRYLNIEANGLKRRSEGPLL